MNRRELLVGMTSALASQAGFPAAFASTYPARPVRLIVAAVPGSAIDLVARALADSLSENLKQSFVVENRTGAGGNLGAGVRRSVRTRRSHVARRTGYDADGEPDHLRQAAV